MSKWLEAQVVDGQLRVRWTDPRPANGKRGLVQFRAPRNLRHHRKYWGMLRAIVDATGRWPSLDAAHRWIKIEIGHYTPHPQPDGTIFAELLPTDFAAMPQQEFQAYYDRAVYALAVETGIDPETIEEERK